MSLSTDAEELLALVGALLRGEGAPGSASGMESGPASASVSPGLSNLLRRHHLRPLAHQAGVPGLKKDYVQCAMINLIHHRTMESFGPEFLARDLPWSVIKGAAYAWTIYDDSALRPMSDIDVLVKADDFERAGQCLLDLGFQERDVSVRTRHAQTYCREAHEVIDLHRSILQPYRSNSDLKRLWGRVKPSETLAGCFELDPIDLTCVHIAHMARHEFSVPLVSYIDLQRLLAALSPTETTCLHDELRRWRLDYAFEVAREITASLSGRSAGRPSARMRIVMPTQSELVKCAHRSRSAQVAKKLALFPRDSAVLGVGWAMRTAEDKLIAARKK